MIAIDTSAILSILLNEPSANDCVAVLEVPTERLLMSAGTLLEVEIVASRKGCRAGLSELPFEIIDVTATRAELAAVAYRRFGKNFHPASLNFGDCFAYATAKEFDCPLLYVGQDFSRTDIHSALAAT